MAPLAGRKVEQRLRNFRPDAASYFAALGGPLPYMTRLRAIDVQTREHEHQLEDAWRGLAAELGDDEGRFAEEWRMLVDRWSFDEVNDLISRHNRWYPVESRLPMDPRTGDYALINGEDFRREPLGVEWALSRFRRGRRAPKRPDGDRREQRREAERGREQVRHGVAEGACQRAAAKRPESDCRAPRRSS